MSLWAYVIMPNHVHLLVWPREDTYRLDRFLYDCKRPVSWRTKEWLLAHGSADRLKRLTVRKGERRVFRFWQAGGGHDRNMIRIESLKKAAHYIHMNPVRSGLAESPEDWQWSSAAAYAGADNVPLRMDPLEL